MRRTNTVHAGFLGRMVLVLMLGACSDLGPVEGSRAELERNRETWQRLRPSSYEYGVERLCFCGFESRGPVRVTVTGDDVSGRTYIDSGDPVPAPLGELFPTVDGLFDVLFDAIEREAYRIDVTYDPISGVPLDLWIDYLHTVADEELGFSVTETVRLPRPR